MFDEMNIVELEQKKQELDTSEAPSNSILYGLNPTEKINLVEEAIEDFGTDDPEQII